MQRWWDVTSMFTLSKTIWPFGGQKVAFRKWEQPPVLQPQVCRFRRGIFPHQAFQGGQSPANTLNAVLWGPKQRTQLSCAWTFDLERLRDDKCVLFYAGKSVVICYMKIVTNKHKLLGAGITEWSTWEVQLQSNNYIHLSWYPIRMSETILSTLHILLVRSLHMTL